MALLEPFELEPAQISPETELQHASRLDLSDHILQDPQTNQGHIVSVEEAPAISTISGDALPCTVYEVQVRDAFVSADPVGYQRVSDYIEKLENNMQAAGFNPLVDDRNEANKRDEWNQFTEAWLHDENVTGLGIWRGLVPTAEALGYLTNPWVDSIISNRDNETGIISKETAAQLRFVDDAVGIRDRAIAMQMIAEEHLADNHENGDKVRWLSLASGTAEPSIIAAKNASDANDLAVDLVVSDIDTEALSYVRRNAEQYGFNGDIKTVFANILDDGLAARLAKKTGSDEQYDIVENLGFEEYLPQEGDELDAKKGMNLPQASDFTRRAFEFVKPGGMLISGNMVLDRPQIGFVFGIVDWPIINARSEESILRVYKEAGILDDPNAKVEMFRVRNADTSKRVYNIVKVTKLAAE